MPTGGLSAPLPVGRGRALLCAGEGPHGARLLREYDLAADRYQRRSADFHNRAGARVPALNRVPHRRQPKSPASPAAGTSLSDDLRTVYRRPPIGKGPEGAPEKRNTDAKRKLPRVAIIGGGITGLAAAHRLRELAAAREMPLEAVVLERAPTFGGSLATVVRDGFVMETGADSMLTEKPWGVELARRLGLEREMIPTREEFRKTYVVHGGKLMEIPPGLTLLAPAHIWPVLKSPLFTPWGKLRMALEPFIPARRDGGDESLASFVRRRLGREVLERVAQPLAGNIYTSDPERLSLEATMPRFLEMERRYGSVIRGLRAAEAARSAAGPSTRTSGARWSLFVSFRAGMRVLVDALAARLSDSIRCGMEVASLSRAGSLWHLEFSNCAPPLEADAVICAAPAYEAAQLVKPHDERLAGLLGTITYTSAATVNLAFRTSDFPRPPDSFGFVVPEIENRRIIAGSFSSLKFEGRAPEGFILARAFLGGALQDRMMTLSDEEMVDAARGEFAALMDVSASPCEVEVRRWPERMPQYAVGHLGRVAEIERAVAGLPGLALAGAAYRGVGVPDCVHGAERAAEAIFERLSSAA